MLLTLRHCHLTSAYNNMNLALSLGPKGCVAFFLYDIMKTVFFREKQRGEDQWKK